MKKLTLILISICFLYFLDGCYRNQILKVNELESGTQYKILSLTTNDGEEKKWSSNINLKAMLNDSILTVINANNNTFDIPLSEIDSIEISKFDACRTAAFIGGGSICIGSLVFVIGFVNMLRNFE